MRIHTKNKVSLVFECGARCQGDSWLRFEVYDNGDKKVLEIDKAGLCCDITLNQRNIDTLVDWLSANNMTSVSYVRNMR